jgi:hypothetical protein
MEKLKRTPVVLVFFYNIYFCYILLFTDSFHLFRSIFKYNIADYYIINRDLRENGRVEFFNDNC